MEKIFTLSSNDLAGSFTKEQIMDNFGCDGGNRSPHLVWENVPEGTKGFAVIMHDPDAPTASGFWHWAVFKLPAGVAELQADAGNPEEENLPNGAFMGTGDHGMQGYGGPCPPAGDFTHSYIITVYALNTDKPEIDESTPLAQAEFKIVTQYELGRASIISYYKKEK